MRFEEAFLFPGSRPSRLTLRISQKNLPTRFTGNSHSRLASPSPSPHRIPAGGSGILTRFPSATALALTLGADSPCADERCAGNLGLSATRPFTLFIATHVSIRTSDISSSPLEPPSQTYGTLLYHR